MSAMLWIGLEIAIVGLLAIEHLARRAGARRLAPRRRRGLLIGLVSLLAVLTVAPRLGLRYGDALSPRIVAGGLFALLLFYIWMLLPRLRPLLGDSLPRRPPIVFFLLPLTVYLALLPWASSERPPDGDEPFYLLITHSLAHDLDADLTNNYAAEDSRSFVDRALEAQPHDPRGPAGEMYSRHNVLLPATLAPAYRVGGKYGALAVMCVFAAALAWMTLRLARHRFGDQPGAVLIAYGILAFTSPLLLYSHQVWVEIPAALLLAVGLDAAWGMNPAEARRLRTWLPLVLSLLLLPLLKIRFIVVAVPLALIVAHRLGRRSWRVVILTLGAGALVAAAILSFNQLRYGNPLKYHDLSRLSFYWTDLSRYPKGLVGLFFDMSFGLFASSPIWALLLIPGRGKRRPLVDLCWIMAPYILLLIPRSEWYGAWSPPFRYGCVALPLFALLLVPPLAQRRGLGARLLLGSLASITALLTVLWVARPGWTYNIAHGRSHLIDIITRSQGVDVARFFPSGVRPNLALWIWPLVLSMSICLLWRWRRRGSSSVAWLGATLPLLGLGIAVMAAHRLPTQVVEVEDPYVQNRGGSSWPEDWVVGRTRFRGGWRLRPWDHLTIPLVAGGDRLALQFELKQFGQSLPRFRLRAGQGPWKTIELGDDREWMDFTVEAIEWPAGEEHLQLSLTPGEPGARAGILFDRIHLTWSSAD